MWMPRVLLPLPLLLQLPPLALLVSLYRLSGWGVQRWRETGTHVFVIIWACGVDIFVQRDDEQAGERRRAKEGATDVVIALE